MSSFTTPEELSDAYTTLNSTFKTGLTKSLAWRKWQLKQLFWMIYDNEPAIAAALHKDLHRHDFESYFADIGGLKKDILEHLAHFEEWAADEIPDAGILFGTLGKARIRKEPRGVALIIGTWNFPFAVTLMPLVAAISAGCCALVKPSEVAAASQDLMAELIGKYLDQSAIRAVTGGAKETALMLEKRFDHIFYTGSPTVGRIVQTAAAKHLTPTVLELGGQAPSIVTKSADMDVAAKRILLSKIVNDGQICLSSNHVIVDPAVHDQFVERVGHWLEEFQKGEGKGQGSHIINERQFDRLSGLLKATKGKIAHGGELNRDAKYIQPAVVTDVTVQDSLMSEEIFGPLLPIIKADYRRACEITNSMEHPLGLYIFSSDQKEIDDIITQTTSGGVTINDVMLHAAIPNAPFGGVGSSGNGAFHGRYGFDTFTHKRSIVSIPGWFDMLLGFRYPPWDKKHISKISSRKDPGFKRGETMEEQKIGGSSVSGAARTVLKWGALVMALGMLDARLGGNPKVVEVASGLVKRVTGR